MTELPERTTSAAKRLAFVTLLAGILVALLALLAPPASASPLLHPETRVAAMAEPNGQFVGPSATVAAVQGRERTPNYDQSATGSSVAAEGGATAASIGVSGAAGEFDVDELAQLTYQHIDEGDIAGRPTLDEIEAALRNSTPTPLEDQNAVQFDYKGVRVIVNEDVPTRSTAYYPGR